MDAELLPSQQQFPNISLRSFACGKERTALAAVVSLILIAAGTGPMFAQSDAARLQGIVTDQTSALVPGAKVQVTDTSTNRILETSVRAG